MFKQVRRRTYILVAILILVVFCLCLVGCVQTNNETVAQSSVGIPPHEVPDYLPPAGSVVYTVSAASGTWTGSTLVSDNLTDHTILSSKDFGEIVLIDTKFLAFSPDGRFALVSKHVPDRWYYSLAYIDLNSGLGAGYAVDPIVLTNEGLLGASKSEIDSQVITTPDPSEIHWLNTSTFWFTNHAAASVVTVNLDPPDVKVNR